MLPRGTPVVLTPQPARSRGEERRQIAQMLHDGPCQTLGGAQLLSQLLLRQPQSAPARLEDLDRILGVAVSELHEILQRLRAED